MTETTAPCRIPGPKVFRHYSTSEAWRTVPAAVLLFAGILVTFSVLDWGMPNASSFAADAAFMPDGCNDAMEMMQANMYKYPPLQYLFYDLLAASTTDPETEDTMAVRFVRARLITACQTLCTTLTVVWLGWLLFSPGTGLLAGAIFALSPMTVYLGHTTKMDQPYVFWLFLCLGCLTYLTHIQGKGREWTIYFTCGVLSGLAAFLGLATKDQIFACLPLPYVMTAVRAWREPQKKTFFITAGSLGTGILAGLAIYAGIWLHAGGLPVFKSHLAWITSEGVSNFRQFGNTQTAGVTAFLFKCGQDVFLGLGPGVAVVGTAGLLVLARQWRRCQNEFGVKAEIAILLSPFFAVAFFVLVTTRFSYPRFWFPLLPGLCILAAAACLHPFNIPSKMVSLFRCLCITSVFLHVLGGLEILTALKNDPRLECRRAFQKMQSPKSKRVDDLVGVAGMEWGVIFIQQEGTVGTKKRALRDWSKAKFGRVAKNQIPFFPDPLTLYCLPVPMVVTDDLKPLQKELFLQAGFKKVASFKRRAIRLSRLEELPEISLHVYARATQGEKPILTSPLWDQIVVAGAHSSTFRRSPKALLRLGHSLSSFDPLSLPEDLHIKNGDLTLAGMAYDEAGRLEDACKALAFAQTRWPSETNLENFNFVAAKIKRQPPPSHKEAE